MMKPIRIKVRDRDEVVAVCPQAAGNSALLFFLAVTKKGYLYEISWRAGADVEWVVTEITHDE